jgi:hypothetical protein
VISDLFLIRRLQPARSRPGNLFSAAKKPLDSSCHCSRILQLAFPNDEHSPSLLLKKLTVGFVAKLIPVELRNPILGAGTRYPSFRAAGMLMPETSVHKYDFPACRENDVRLSGQVEAMQPEPISDVVNEAAKDNFRVRVLAAYAPHVRTAVFRTDLIHRRPQTEPANPLRWLSSALN